MTQRERAIWTACVVDSEGWIGMRWKPKPHDSYYPHVIVTNTSLVLIRRLKSWWGGRINVLPRRSSKHRRAWSWQLEYRKAGEFLKIIMPHLLVKSKQARFAIQVSDSLVYCGRHHRVPVQVRRMRHNAWRMVRHLNSGVLTGE